MITSGRGLTKWGMSEVRANPELADIFWLKKRKHVPLPMGIIDLSHVL